MQRIEGLIRSAEQFVDPAAQAVARELVASLLELHGVGLARMLELAADERDAFARDGLVGSLLLLHGLHPQDLESRVAGALEKVRPFLHSHGGDVELIAVADGAVRLRMRGSCDGCPSSAATLKLTVEEAVYEAAPDVTLIEVEGVTDAPPPPRPAMISLPVLAGGAPR
jgi:Fe-S cluster biogenesis protein NfuA